MDIRKETTETRRLIGVFKDLYVGGADDALLRDKAKEIFDRIDEEMKGVRGNSIVMQLMTNGRKEFERYVGKVCKNRHAPLLLNFLFQHMKTHH